MGSTVPAIALLVVSLALLLPSPIGAGAAAAAAPHSPVVLPTASPRVVGGHGAPPIFTTAAASAPSAPNPVPFLRTLAPPPVPRPSTVNTSAVFETPPPVPPTTTPVVYTIAHLLVINRSSCCALLNFTPPARPWGMIELNFTGFISGTVYDSSYRFTADGLPVAFGTLPEISHWTILKDLTEYESLFVGNVSFQFILGVATLGGIWTANITLAFFPPETGHAPPSEPNTIVPIWPFIGIQNARPNVSAIVSVPTNATNATLELYAYGFVNDEFWYSTPRPFRDLEISVDGGGLASVIPFAYVNTGGLSDPSLWDPITG
ncbi:MAG TPA: peptide-N4-asparagine amidase, partial [Thermoplasmata archaeon]|nr:peptide-N4-asparagine amidase [Thermoplasmata archaeon]